MRLDTIHDMHHTQLTRITTIIQMDYIYPGLHNSIEAARIHGLGLRIHSKIN